ncbi:substrate-binding periplasmic protein [Halobacteriovorax marinus]|uniref:substrate-binding periplasmic protein n=1 Tax=Halobacteriovorax marinus TaxID=97084 RepID=UPI003A8DAB79
MVVLNKVFSGIKLKAILILLFSLISIEAHSKVRVVLFDVAPFSYINENGKLDGLVYNLCKKIEKESNLEFTYTLVPYARAIKLLRDGEMDMAIFYPSSKYKKDFDQLTPTLGNINYLVSLKDIQIKKLSDIGSRKIAFIRGAKYSPEFDALEKPGTVFMQDYSKALQMLLLNRVDIVVISSAAFKYFISENKLDAGKGFNTFMLNEQKNWIHLRKGISNEIKSALEQANEKVIKSNQYQSLEDLF